MDKPTTPIMRVVKTLRTTEPAHDLCAKLFQISDGRKMIWIDALTLDGTAWLDAHADYRRHGPIWQRWYDYRHGEKSRHVHGDMDYLYGVLQQARMNGIRIETPPPPSED